MHRRLTSILLIDDDEPTNFLHALVISEQGCAQHLHIAQSGTEAIAYLKQAAEGKKEAYLPQLIFLDINMPAMNGWEFLQQFAEMNFAGKETIKIVLLTTSLFPEDKQKALATAGVVDFLSKPLTGEQLDYIFETHFK